MSALSSAEISSWNRTLATLSPEEIVRWALRTAGDRAVVSTNFRPYEAVLLHLVTRQRADIPVLWVDHGYNRPATYRHAEALRRQLGLNVKPYLPLLTAAHRDALHGPIPTPADEAALRDFSQLVKIEPFRRGMRELAPRLWLTSLRRSQNASRAAFAHVSWDENFGVIKVNPLLDWDDAQMDAYLDAHSLPNEFDYFDPAKADEKRECGLHASWAAAAGGHR